MARTALNKQAGEWLRMVRGKKRSAARFAANLTLVLETAVTPNALYAWENGIRTVPAAVMLAASQIAGEPIALNALAKKRWVDDVIDELERRQAEKEGG